MKNLALLLSIVFFISCEKDEPVITTYIQVVNNSTEMESVDPYLNGAIYDVVIFTYIEDDVSGQVNIDKVGPEGDVSDKIKIDNKVTKVKLSFEFIPPESDYYEALDLDRQYTVAFTFIDKGENNQIIIDDNTMISSQRKKSTTSIQSTLHDLCLNLE